MADYCNDMAFRNEGGERDMVNYCIRERIWEGGRDMADHCNDMAFGKERGEFWKEGGTWPIIAIIWHSRKRRDRGTWSNIAMIWHSGRREGLLR